MFYTSLSECISCDDSSGQEKGMFKLMDHLILNVNTSRNMETYYSYFHITQEVLNSSFSIQETERVSLAYTLQRPFNPAEGKNLSLWKVKLLMKRVNEKNTG